jgi:cation diffusion facilitator CzcD-associated flavoprotein CzcO
MPVSNSSASLPPISRIAVVGGGALGVRQTGLLLEEGVPIEKIVCYESKGRLGGLWYVYLSMDGGCTSYRQGDGGKRTS